MTGSTSIPAHRKAGLAPATPHSPTQLHFGTCVSKDARTMFNGFMASEQDGPPKALLEVLMTAYSNFLEKVRVATKSLENHPIHEIHMRYAEADRHNNLILGGTHNGQTQTDHTPTFPVQSGKDGAQRFCLTSKSLVVRDRINQFEEHSAEKECEASHYFAQGNLKRKEPSLFQELLQMVSGLGSGRALYVSAQLLKKCEGEVQHFAQDMGLLEVRIREVKEDMRIRTGVRKRGRRKRKKRPRRQSTRSRIHKTM